MSGYPHVRRVSAYLFFAVCAYGCGILAVIALLAMGVSRDLAKEALAPFGLAAFLALRDMTSHRVTTPSTEGQGE